MCKVATWLSGYFALYQMLMDTTLLKVEGLLVVDNVMYKGEELSGKDLSVNGLGAQALNQGLLDDHRVHQVMLPLRALGLPNDSLFPWVSLC